MDRINVAALFLSASALVGIALHEGYKPDAYIPTKGDVPTIGFGTTGGVKIGDKTTPERALVRLLDDASRFEKAVKTCAPVPMYQREFDSYVSFTYNVGPNNFCNSTLVKLLKAGDYDGACKQLLRWTYYQGKDCKLQENKKLCGGLVERRQREYEQCSGS